MPENRMYGWSYPEKINIPVSFNGRTLGSDPGNWSSNLWTGATTSEVEMKGTT